MPSIAAISPPAFKFSQLQEESNRSTPAFKFSQRQKESNRSTPAFKFSQCQKVSNTNRSTHAFKFSQRQKESNRSTHAFKFSQLQEESNRSTPAFKLSLQQEGRSQIYTHLQAELASKGKYQINTCLQVQPAPGEKQLEFWGNGWCHFLFCGALSCQQLLQRHTHVSKGGAVACQGAQKPSWAHCMPPKFWWNWKWQGTKWQDIKTRCEHKHLRELQDGQCFHGGLCDTTFRLKVTNMHGLRIQGVPPWRESLTITTGSAVHYTNCV